MKLYFRTPTPRWKTLAIGSVCLLFAAVSATAQSRVELGYVHVYGNNDFDAADWASVDRGHGHVFAFRHDWSALYLELIHQRVDLDNRNLKPTRQCISVGPGIPPICEDRLSSLRFTDRYRRYAVELGWKHELSNKASLWIETTSVHDRWENSGGTERLLPNGLAATIDDQSTNQWTWGAGAGADLRLGESFTLSAGFSYQHKTYHAVVGGPRRPRGPEQLFEGLIRGTQRFGRHFGGYLEYRPSDQRHWAQVGVGFRF